MLGRMRKVYTLFVQRINIFSVTQDIRLFPTYDYNPQTIKSLILEGEMKDHTQSDQRVWFPKQCRFLHIVQSPTNSAVYPKEGESPQMVQISPPPTGQILSKSADFHFGRLLGTGWLSG